MILILAANQRRPVPRSDRLAQMRWDVADGKSDAAVVGAVRRGAVKQQHVMERRLARLQLDMDGVRLIDLDRDLLAAGEQVVPLGGLASSGNSSTS